MSPIQLVAECYRAPTRRDDCGEIIIPGHHGQVFDYGDGESFGIVLLDDDVTQPSKARLLLSQRRKALAAGFVAHQLGDCEAVLLFDPNKSDQAKLALKLVGVRRRRKLSDPHRRSLLAASRTTQYDASTTVLQGTSAT